MPSKKLVTLFLFPLFCALLNGCATDPVEYNSNLRTGMTLSQVALALAFRASAEDNPFQDGCLRESYPDKNIGIISPASRKAFYIFVNQPTSLIEYCLSTRNSGSYATWFRTFAEARRFVNGYRDGTIPGTTSETQTIAAATTAAITVADGSITTENPDLDSSVVSNSSPIINEKSEDINITSTSGQEDSIQTLHSRLRVGLGKVQTRNILRTLVDDESPFGRNCFRLYNRAKRIEVLAGRGQDDFYVFNRVSTRSSADCSDSEIFSSLGDGNYVTVLKSLDQVNMLIASAPNWYTAGLNQNSSNELVEPVPPPDPPRPLQGGIRIP